MTCSVELLCVGYELLTGKTVNTNATWLAREISHLGGRLIRVITVGDNLGEIEGAARSILTRKPDFMLTSGGLGPTFDDMTIKGLARALRLRLRVNEEALNQIRNRYKEIFGHKRFVLTKFRVKMATFPVGAKPLLNPEGTAPGMMVQAGETTIISLPGVPKELRAIFSRHVAPMIRLKAGAGGYLSQSLLIRGVFESELAPLIERVMKRHPNVYVKSHPKGGEGRAESRIEMHFSYTGPDLDVGRRALSNAVEYMKRHLSRRTIVIERK